MKGTADHFKKLRKAEHHKRWGPPQPRAAGAKKPKAATGNLARATSEESDSDNNSSHLRSKLLA